MPNKSAESGRLIRSPALLDASRSVLLAIDLQQRLLTAVDGGERVAWNARRLIDGAGLLGVSIGWTEQVPEKLGPTEATLAERLQQHAAVGPLAKAVFSCGEHAAPAHAWLDQGRTQAVLCGVETHVCVLQTGFDYLAAGFEVFVVADAVGTRHAFDQQIALRRLEASGASLVTTESVLCEWTGAATHPQFRAISGLMKESGPTGS